MTIESTENSDQEPMKTTVAENNDQEGLDGQKHTFISGAL